ncbi:hypothetical protein J19TS2_05560 [Cohnella xylanilytica]|uniref:LysE family translocator n=1 Tax=Cohnella xylanilytica TaxID=557555 RepID=UPI001B2A1F0F|nr:LysE family transporter [Cohnella xylanilytica]GIO11001.1 hypothetical protein J19TS2_05560 [Cohnella xylanilytica]
MYDIVYSFAKGFLLSLALCLDMGVVNIAIMKTGLDRGFAASFRIGFGSCFGDAFYLLLALLGWTAIFKLPAVEWILWIGGTLVLLWLTKNMIRDTIRPKKLDPDSPQTGAIGGEGRPAWKDVAVGLGLAVSSPTLILSFAVIAGPVVADIDIRDAGVMTSFVIGFFAAGLLWSLVIAWLGSRASRLGQGTLRALSLASAALFLAFAVSLFVNGLRSLVLGHE